MLYRAVYNVLSNSIQAIDGKGELRICGVRGKTAILQFHDSGPGFDMKQLDKMLDPFFTTRRDDGGTGLGLSISEKIVNDHKGILEFESKPGSGLTARILLPCSDKYSI